MRFLFKKMDSKLLAKKFQGCLLGALLGDCLGAPFEGDDMHTKLDLLKQYFHQLYHAPSEVPLKVYTDDTAMTKSLMISLIEEKTLNPKHLAQQFVQEYYLNEDRGYGSNVPKVFAQLKADNFSSVFEPAKLQFGGVGSAGNGGAMRIAPIALFFHKDFQKMIEAATAATQITHSNPQGILGALLQCIAVHQSLLLNPKEPLDIDAFCESLCKKICSIEKTMAVKPNDPSYATQITKMHEILNKKIVDREEIIKTLGNKVVAFYSVPTAIYCFLRSYYPINWIETDNPIMRSIYLAISLGGDTDTIASMAGSIAGAYYGNDYIDEVVLNNCEFSNETKSLIQKLFIASCDLA